MAHFVAADFLEPCGRCVVTGRVSLFRELPVHGVHLVRLPLDRVSQVGGVVTDEVKENGACSRCRATLLGVVIRVYMESERGAEAARGFFVQGLPHRCRPGYALSRESSS